MPALGEVRLSPTARFHLVQAVARAAPEEAAGFLLGQSRIDRSTWSVTDARPGTNVTTEDPRTSFALDPMETLAVDRGCSVGKCSLIGFYHSHPTGPSGPSESDRVGAFPGYLYLVGSRNCDAEWEFRSYLAREDPSTLSAGTNCSGSRWRGGIAPVG